MVYGENRPYRVRARVVVIIGVVLVALATIGATVGTVVHHAMQSDGSRWWPMAVVLTMTIVVATCAFIVDALRLGAPGAFLMLLAMEVASFLPSVGVSIAATTIWTAVGAATAMVVSMSGMFFRPRTAELAAVAAAVTSVDAVLADNTAANRRAALHDLHAAWQCLHDAGLVGADHSLVQTLAAAHARCTSVVHGHDHGHADPEDDLRPEVPLRRPSVRYRLRRAAHPGGRSATIVVRLLVAGPVAGGIAVALDLGRPDWAVITAAMILHQGPDRILGTYRAVHRFLGTVLGLTVLAGLSFVEPSGLGLVLILALALAGTEGFLVRNYGIAMVFITPMVVILGALGTPDDLASVCRDRMLETILGVAVAVAVVWGVRPRAHRWGMVDADDRVSETIAKIVASTDPHELPELRRDLAFDLHASTTAAITAAHTEPAWTRKQWPEHRRLHELGYRLLTS